MKNYVISFLLLLFFIPVAECQETVIGVIVPLSGPYAHFGEAGRIGLELGLAKGEGGSQSKIRLIYEDSQYDAAKAVSAYMKLVNVEHVKALVVLGSPPSSSIIPLAEKDHLPVFAWTASTKLTKGHPNVVRLMASARLQGEAMSAEARRRGIAKTAYFAAQNELSQSVRDAFVVSFGSGNIIASEEFAPSEQDFRASILRARTAAQAIGICLNTGQIPAFLSQLKHLGFSGPLFGCHALAGAEVAASLRSNGFTAWFVEGKMSSKFRNEFEARSSDTSGIWVAAGFHDVGILVSSFPVKPDIVRTMIGATIPNSAFGQSRVAEGEEGIFLEMPLGFTSIENGRFVRNID